MSAAEIKDAILRYMDQPELEHKTVTISMLVNDLDLEPTRCVYICNELECNGLLKLKKTNTSHIVYITDEGSFFAKYKSFADTDQLEYDQETLQIEREDEAHRFQLEQIELARRSTESSERSAKSAEDSTIAALSSAKSGKVSMYISIGAVLLTTISTWYAIQQNQEAKTQNNKVSELESKLKSLDSLFHLQQLHRLETKAKPYSQSSDSSGKTIYLPLKVKN